MNSNLNLGIKDVVLLSFCFHPSINKQLAESSILHIKTKMIEYRDVFKTLNCVDVGNSARYHSGLLVGYFQVIISICEEKMRPTGKLERLELEMETYISGSPILGSLYTVALEAVTA